MFMMNRQPARPPVSSPHSVGITGYPAEGRRHTAWAGYSRPSLPSTQNGRPTRSCRSIVPRFRPTHFFFRVTDLITTSSFGTFWCPSFVPTFTSLILSTTSIPFVTLPNTQ